MRIITDAKLRELLQQARAEERERCARKLEEIRDRLPADSKKIRLQFTCAAKALRAGT